MPHLEAMTARSSKADPPQLSHALHEAMRLHEIEGNPLDREDVEMFLMFERERLSPEQRRAFIIAKARRGALVTAE